MKTKISTLILTLGFVVFTLTSYSQNIVKRSKVCGLSNTVEMTISGHGTSTVTVTTSQVTPNTGDVSLLSVLDGTLTSTQFSVPNDGHKYWIIFFDPNHGPDQIASGQGSGYTTDYRCDCSEGGVGTCTMITTGSGDKGCTNTSCTHCCELVEVPPVISFAGPAVVVQADTLIFNGTTY